jgi:hypothetical protein
LTQEKKKEKGVNKSIAPMMNTKNIEEEEGSGSRCTDLKQAVDVPRGSAAEVRRRR